jgi:hypothetical protein
VCPVLHSGKRSAEHGKNIRGMFMFLQVGRKEKRKGEGGERGGKQDGRMWRGERGGASKTEECGGGGVLHPFLSFPFLSPLSSLSSFPSSHDSATPPVVP